MSLKEEKSYWIRCDGRDQTGECHTSVGPSRIIPKLFERAVQYGWRIDGDLTEALCPRHQIEVK